MRQGYTRNSRLHAFRPQVTGLESRIVLAAGVVGRAAHAAVAAHGGADRTDKVSGPTAQELAPASAAAAAQAEGEIHAARDCSSGLSEADVRAAVRAPGRPGKRASQDRLAAYAVRLDRYNKNVAALTNFLNSDEARTKDGINTPERQAAFLAQVGHETAGLTQNVERPSSETGKAFEKYDFRSNLGNDGVGQGYLYRGQGGLQLTGKDNYKAVNNALGLAGTANDIVANPSLVGASPELSARTAGAYWAMRKNPGTGLSLNETADGLKGATGAEVAAVTRDITRGINPGERFTNTSNAKTNKIRKEATADRIGRTNRALGAIADCQTDVPPGPVTPGQGTYSGAFVFNGLGEFFGQSKGTMTVAISSANGTLISGTLTFTNLAGANRSGSFAGMLTNDGAQNFTGTADGILGGSSVTFIGTLAGNTVSNGRLASGAGDGEFSLAKA